MTGRNAILASTAALALTATPAVAQDATGTYRADLQTMNFDTTGRTTTGSASVEVSGDTVTFRVEAMGAPPDMMHLQHIHGFAEGSETSGCPSMDADTNGDGVIDVIETEPVAGLTMVPFHDDPLSMQIVAESYPVADAAGSYIYERSVPLADLRTAFAEAFPGQELDFDRRVVFIHSVPADTDLPDSVQSLGDVPAHVTLPIACGEIRTASG